MEALRSSETTVTIYQTSWSHIPEENNLHGHRRENLKSIMKVINSQFCLHSGQNLNCLSSIYKHSISLNCI
jgi:hypothetical protein